MTVEMKLKKRSKHEQTRTRYDLNKLKDPAILRQFQAKLGGRFAPLLLLEDVQEISSEMKKVTNQTAEEVLGKQKMEKQPWRTPEVT